MPKPWILQWLKSYGSNFSRVTPSIYRGAQPSARDLVKMKRDYGIQAVLNLRDDVGSEEVAEVKAAGLLWYAVPMRDDAAPTDAQIRSALGVLRSGITVLLHCKGGRHRTGALIAVYRVVEQNWSKERAWEEAYKYGYYRFGGHGPIEDWFLKDFDPAQF